MITNFKFKLDVNVIERHLEDECNAAIESHYCEKLCKRLEKMGIVLKEDAVKVHLQYWRRV